MNVTTCTLADAPVMESKTDTVLMDTRRRQKLPGRT
jgi:hypothetical protein